MNTKKFATVALSAIMCASSALAFSSCEENIKADAVLNLNGENTLNREISSDLFGIFLEDINYAGDALNAEMVLNKTFGYSDKSGKKGWNSYNGVNIEVIKADDGLSTTNGEYLRVETTSNAWSGIENSGFTEGMAITKNHKYNFSVYIRATDYSGKVKVAFSDGDNEYGSTEFTVTKDSDWVKYEAQLTATESVSENLFAQILFEKVGKLDVDVVSLKDDNNINGFRKDLAEALYGLSPKFVRFPGGCIIEGKTLEKAYNWKDSIGVDRDTDKVVEITTKVVKADGSTATETAVGSDAARRTGSNIWNYSTDYGIGFYEYFMLCDYLGATAVPIVNCGIACMTQGNGRLPAGQTKIGSDEFNYYVDCALDLVAFAKGDVNSSDPNEAYWASVRTAMGHAEPFEMDYLGIGNEQWTDAYFEHFEAFRDIFIEKAKENPIYSSVQLIVGNGCLFTDTEAGVALAKTRINKMRKEGYIETNGEYGMVDEHYYMNYTDFLDHTDHYDSYSRNETSRYDVFAGEYSANQESDIAGNKYSVVFNSIKTATAEAAYMTGIERNGDVVKLAAYAPVFGHLDSTYTQWAVDMIYYNNETYVPTANYYVQQMFAQNQGKYVLESSIEFNEESAALETFTIGKEGKNVVKTEKSLYQVATIDENGDIVIKLVNANTTEDINVQINLSNAQYSGKTEVTVLRNDDPNAKNTLADMAVVPESKTMNTKKNFVITAYKNSVTVLRIHVK